MYNMMALYVKNDLSIKTKDFINTLKCFLQ